MRSYWSSASLVAPFAVLAASSCRFALAGMGVKRHQSDASRPSEYVHEVADATSDQHDAQRFGKHPGLYPLYT